MRNDRKSVLMMLLACLLLAAGLLASFGAAGAFAALGDSTSVVKEKLEVAKVSCRVNSDSYSVTNTGNIPALIRAKLIVNWVDANGNPMMYAPEGAEYQLETSSLWTHVGDPNDPTDGFWYCTRILSAGEMTPKLVSSLTVTGGGELRVELLAEAIQAAPADAVQEAWGVSYAEGVWSE